MDVAGSSPVARSNRSVRKLAGHGLTAVAAIDAKIRVRGQEHGIRPGLRHPDEAGVGKAHRNIRILLQEMERTIEIVAQIESRDDGISPEEL